MAKTDSVVYYKNLLTKKSLKLRDTAVYNKKPNYIIDVGRTLEKLVNEEPKASDLQAFVVFSQHPGRVGYHDAKPIESVVYYLLYK